MAQLIWIFPLLLFLINGVRLQRTESPQTPKTQRPKIVWASPVATKWQGINDRQWMLQDPPANPYAFYTPPPTPAPTTLPPPTQSTPPSYPAPYQPEPYQPSYNTPAYYEPPQAPHAPQAPNGYYYYYYPMEKPEKSSWKDLLKKQKEVSETLLPGKHLSESQKIWIAVLAPLIVVALVVPLAAILLANFTITTTKRSDHRLSEITSEMAARAGALLESDECMQRIICNLGSYTSAVPGKSYLLSLLDNMVPETMQKNMEIFKEAANEEDSNCKRFHCSSWKF